MDCDLELDREACADCLQIVYILLAMCHLLPRQTDSMTMAKLSKGSVAGMHNDLRTQPATAEQVLATWFCRMELMTLLGPPWRRKRSPVTTASSDRSAATGTPAARRCGRAARPRRAARCLLAAEKGQATQVSVPASITESEACAGEHNAFANVTNSTGLHAPHLFWIMPDI